MRQKVLRAASACPVEATLVEHLSDKEGGNVMNAASIKEQVADLVATFKNTGRLVITGLGPPMNSALADIGCHGFSSPRSESKTPTGDFAPTVPAFVRGAPPSDEHCRRRHHFRDLTAHV